MNIRPVSVAMLIELPMMIAPIARAYRAVNSRAPVAKTITSALIAPAPIDEAMIIAARGDHPIRPVATLVATLNMTISATPIHTGLPMTPVKITLITASWSVPRRMAMAGDHTRGTRKATSTTVATIVRTDTPTREGAISPGTVTSGAY